MTLTECVLAWEFELGLARSDNPLLELLTDEQRSRMLDCQRTKGCERGGDHYGRCQGVVEGGTPEDGPWWVDTGIKLDQRFLKGITE